MAAIDEQLSQLSPGTVVQESLEVVKSISMQIHELVDGSFTSSPEVECYRLSSSDEINVTGGCLHISAMLLTPSLAAQGVIRYNAALQRLITNAHHKVIGGTQFVRLLDEFEFFLRGSEIPLISEADFEQIRGAPGRVERNAWPICVRSLTLNSSSLDGNRVLFTERDVKVTKALSFILANNEKLDVEEARLSGKLVYSFNERSIIRPQFGTLLTLLS